MGMHHAGESSESVRAGEAIAPLRGLLELSRLTRSQPTLVETLRAVASTVAEGLGFATVVINSYRPESDEYEVVVVQGSDRAREILLGHVSQGETWTPLLADGFRTHGVYFIPEGAVGPDLTVTWYTPELDGPPAQDDDAWHSEDALFAVLEGSDGTRYGTIAIDEPASGLRPSDEQLEIFGALAAHASLLIESSRQVAALQSAVARSRAVITGALDCVIAVDEADRLVEFNPAAERTFDYRAEDVLGRDAGDLLVPPSARDAYRSAAQHIRRNPRSSLLERRIETTAIRSDGSEFPVELTLTRVEGADDEGPLFYGIVRDIAERRRGEEQLAYLAYHDSLTGLPNRILVEQELDLALARARRANTAAALMFVDLDDFKEVNDRLGHAAGDRLLAGVATRLRSVLRDTDVLARQGGDEFLVLLADLSDDPVVAAENVGGKLLEALREPFVVSDTEIRTGASIGISLYPADAADTEALLRHADAAMYTAKAAGGGRYVFHERTDALASRRSSVTAQLREAVARGQLELHYQPVWSLEEGRHISGLEALLRWRHPEQGLLTPDAFMSLVEQSTAGDELMGWTLTEVARQARDWLREGLTPRIGINVPLHQLVAPEFGARLDACLAGHDLSPANFAVELTESAWTVDSAETLEVIDGLRVAGYTMTLDDFGSGYSSLSRLGELRFDVVKVDGRMLVGVPDDELAVKLLQAVLDLVDACGATLIAEGVSDERQLEFLVARGVTRVQGPLLAEAMTAEELTPLLRRLLRHAPAPRRRAYPGVVGR